MNIRPVSRAVTAYSRQNNNKTNENPSFSALRTPFPAPVDKFIKKMAGVNQGLELAIGHVTTVQKNHPSLDISPRIDAHNGQRTLVLDLVRRGQRQPLKTIVAQNPATNDNLTDTFYEASRVATEWT